MTLAEYVSIYMQANEGARHYHVAEHLGLAAPHLSELLTGRKTPSLRLAQHLHIRTGGRVRLDGWLRHTRSRVA